MRIYTRGGDRGQTGLLGGIRVDKDHPRIEACGDVDELNSLLGLVLTRVSDQTMVGQLKQIQADLFCIGSQLADPSQRGSVRLRPEAVTRLEHQIDEWQTQVPPLQAFILPGGAGGAAEIHVARAVARRAERRVVTLARTTQVPPEVLAYLNRLSDYLFVLARVINHHAGGDETRWSADTA